jgi:hypothetical protein
MTILIVTGSRSLDNKSDARQWVESKLSSLLLPTHVFIRDERGPNTWAYEYFRSITHVTVFESQTGYMHQSRVQSPSSNRWISEVEIVKLSVRERCLACNAEMVRRAFAITNDVNLVAFVDPSSRTHGTMHTVNQVPMARPTKVVTIHKWRSSE